MDGVLLAVGLALAAIGGTVVATTLASVRRGAGGDLQSFILDVDLVDAEPVDEFERQLREPFRQRVLRSIPNHLLDRAGRALPRNYLGSVERKLALAGSSASTRSQEFVAGQLLLAGALALATLLFIIFGSPPRRLAFVLLALPVLGLLAPSARLDRAVRTRQQEILKDLPDTLDLLAISVEAGLGFEGALDVVCRHFESPLGEEFRLTLQEMELGLPRHEAFQNLKQRTEVPELSSFILALLQGDALGIPVGRVLKTQAADLRSQRRMWAREKAGKLPVKMLFPLIVFIFPPIFVVTLGPAAGSLLGL